MAVTTILSMWRSSANWARKSCFLFQNNLKGADWLRHILVHSATVMALDKNLAMSPSSSVHCGQYDTTYTTIGCVLRRHLLMTQFRVFTVNQHVYEYAAVAHGTKNVEKCIAVLIFVYANFREHT